MRSHSEGNAIIGENRREEKRRDNNTVVATAPTPQDRSLKFYETLKPFVDEFGKDMVRAFYEYWIEPSKSGKKLRFEDEKFFDVKRRLITWKSRQSSVFNKPSTVNKYKLQ